MNSKLGHCRKSFIVLIRSLYFFSCVLVGLLIKLFIGSLVLSVFIFSSKISYVAIQKMMLYTVFLISNYGA